MAYGDRVDPKSRAASTVLMAAFVTLVIWGLAVGMDVSVVKKIAEQLDVIAVEEEPPPPPDEPPPPPPPVENLPPPPPVVIPPSPIPPPRTPNVIRDTTPRPPQVYVPTPVITPPAPPAPPPPPAVDLSKGAQPRTAQNRWVTTGDYPPRSLRSGAEGTTRVSLSVNAEGRVTGCSVISSSGDSQLDSATCSNAQRRARYRPALDRSGKPIASTETFAVTWQIPAD